MELPSIATDICGCNEIVKDGVNGLLVPARDEEALRQAMTASGMILSGAGEWGCRRRSR